MPCVVTAGVPTRNARGRHRRLRVVGNGVLVERDSGRVAARLRLLARDADAAQVDEREVGVGAARDGAHALGGKSVGERLRVRDDLAGVRLVLGLLRLAQGDGLAATACISGPPWLKGNTALSIFWASSSVHTIMPPRGPRRTLCRERDDVGVRNRRRDRLARDQADEGCVDEQARSHLVGDRPERSEIDQPGGYAVAPQMIIFGACSLARSRTWS